MERPIKIELSGRDPVAWNRINSKLMELIEGTVECLMADLDHDKKEEVALIGKDIAKLTTNWIQAKFESSPIDNELKLVEINKRFEEIKNLQIQRQLNEVKLEKQKLELWEKRIMTALNILSVANKCFTKDENGNAVLILTNQQLADLKSGIKFLTDDN